MEESVGNPKGYKSAFLLFYINKHILEEIEKQSNPVFSMEFASQITIAPEIQKQIKMKNYEFELE